MENQQKDGRERRHGFVADRYHPGGQALSDTESLSFYGALLPGMQIHSPDLALRIRAEKLAPERLSRLASASTRDGPPPS